MKKPEKLKMTNGITHNRFISGYNQACEDWEAYHNWDIKELKEKHRKELSILLDRLERVNLDMNVVICDCGEPYKDTDPHIELKDIIQELAGAIHQAQGDK